MKNLLAGLIAITFLAACAPEVGSKQWRTNMLERPKGDWTTNDVADYAKHCLLK